MRARAVSVLTTGLVAVIAAMTATLTTAVSPAFACGGGDCSEVSSSPYGWFPWAQQVSSSPAGSGTGAEPAAAAGAGGGEVGGGDDEGAPVGGGGTDQAQTTVDPCSYAPVAGAPDLVAQTCPGNTDLGTTAAKLLPIAAGGTPASSQAPAQAPGPVRPKVTPQQLELQATQALVVPLPQVDTAPPRGSDGLVGLPEWFWLPAAQWAAMSKRATAGAVWAQVTAQPQTLTIDPGDGSAFTCAGPGTAYNPGLPASAQDSGCTHLYTVASTGQPGLAYQVTVTVTWTATWAGSGGAGGPLPPLNRQTTFPLRVAEGQALIPATA
jgi:hypothetical protein